MSRLAVVVNVGLGTILGLCTACASPAGEWSPAPATTAATGAAAVRDEAKPLAPKPTLATAGVGPQSAPAGTFAKAGARAPSSLRVKRFVVASSVKDREPQGSLEPLRADGSAIFAFAELANPHGASENVRITFERKGGVERVGNVTLPVPGQAPRHRTWAMTRFIRAAGDWDAVLWSESGQELGRTSFEVSAS